MLISKSSFFAVILAFVGSTCAVQAQNTCSVERAPQGTVPACGTGPGQYRPQPWTLSREGVPERTNGSMYAPSGPRQENWNQYDPSTGRYGPAEPNPYNQNGNLSVPRVIKHLYTTRIKPRF
jgi:hypothetical protein